MTAGAGVGSGSVLASGPPRWCLPTCTASQVRSLDAFVCQNGTCSALNGCCGPTIPVDGIIPSCLWMCSSTSLKQCDRRVRWHYCVKFVLDRRCHAAQRASSLRVLARLAAADELCSVSGLCRLQANIHRRWTFSCHLCLDENSTCTPTAYFRSLCHI